MVHLMQIFVRKGVVLFMRTMELGVSVFYSVRERLKPSVPRRNITRADSEGCRDIIKAEVVRSSAEGEAQLVNQIPPFESRARPNNRLVHAFGINNCFTTAEKERCMRFKTDARRLIRLDDLEWRELSSSVRQVVMHSLQFEEHSKRNLFDLMQIVTMKSILAPLCGFDSSRIDVDDELQTLAREINRQWLASKDSLEKDTEFVNQPELKSALAIIAPEWNGLDNTKNPLNFILPGYETLWRVVLRGFLEVIYRAKEPDRANWRHALEDFALEPTLTQLDRTHTGYGGVSACMIVDETLRLYPPTRRIYRTFQDAGGEEVEMAADIESLHRDATAWGDDVLTFNPCRWLSKCDEIKFRNAKFMPFGASPFACVAKARGTNEAKEKCLPFGVSIIAILLGCLSAGVDSNVTPGGGDDGGGWETDQPLKTGREDYRDVMIEKN